MQRPRPPSTSTLTRTDARRLDGIIESAMTGAGIQGVDPLATVTRAPPVHYTPHRAKAEYRSSWAAAREIDRPAGDLVAGGFELQDLPPGFDAAAIMAALDDLGSSDAPEDRGAAALLSRLFGESLKLGGAALVWVLDDGLEPWEPLDLERIREVVSIELLERDEISPWRENAWGPVTHYVVGTSRTSLTAASIVHASRVIIGRDLRSYTRLFWQCICYR